MRKERSSSSAFVSPGISLLLVIFLILCLVTFAILSLSTAKADRTLTEKTADHKSSYYAAYTEAEEKLNAIDAFLEKCYKENHSRGAYLAAIKKNATKYDFQYITSENSAPSLLYYIQSSDTQSLRTQIRLTDPYAGASVFYVTVDRSTVNNDKWDGDNILNLSKSTDSGDE